MKVLIILAIIISIPVLLIVGTIGFIKISNRINRFLYEVAKSDKSIVLIIAMLATTNTQGQITPTLSLGTGYEFRNSGIPVQLSAGLLNKRSELVAGYTVFFHKADATIPKVLFLRYGLALPIGSLEIVPLIGAGMLTATSYRVPVENSGDPNHVFDNYMEIITPQQYKVLYGLKVQKPMGLGGLFMSVEHCKLTYLNAGLYVKIKN